MSKKTDNRYVDLFAPIEQNKFTQVAINPQNLTLSSEAALISFRMEELTASLATAIVDWKEFAEAWDQLKTGYFANGGLGVEQSIEKIDAMQKSASIKDALWREILQLIKNKCSLVEAETKLKTVEQKLVDVKQVEALLADILELIKATISDVKIRTHLLQLIKNRIASNKS